MGSRKSFHFICAALYLRNRKCDPPLFNPPTPTAQTGHDRGLKFGMLSPWGRGFWAIEAIFDILPLSQDMGLGWGCPLGSQKITNFFLYFFSFFTSICSI